MKTIRKNVFETNSSSTHSITVMSKEDYDKWSSDNYYWDSNNAILLTHEDMVNKYLSYYNLTEIDDENVFQDWLSDIRCEIYNQEQFENTSLEYNLTDHTTQSGDEIIILCKYGYNY